MFQIRSLKANDKEKLFTLYKNVASQNGGISRSVSEIDKNYINSIIKSSLNNGVSFVMDNEDKSEIISEIHCQHIGPAQFSHVLTNVTILVHQDYQGKGLGKQIFTFLLNYLEQKRPDILRLELFTRDSNTKAIEFYEKLGFKIEGKFENRVLLSDNKFESDIAMAWFNKNYNSNVK